MVFNVDAMDTTSEGNDTKASRIAKMNSKAQCLNALTSGFPDSAGAAPARSTIAPQIEAASHDTFEPSVEGNADGCKPRARLSATLTSNSRCAAQSATPKPCFHAAAFPRTLLRIRVKQAVENA